MGDPYLIENVLVKYPKLRIYIAHIGTEWYEHTLVMMYTHPSLYTDLAAVLWWHPLFKYFGKSFLLRAKEIGLLKRVMFGSDQMMWAHGIDMSIDYLNSLEFLTHQEKLDVFYNNAARFLKLKTQNQIKEDSA